MPIDRTIVDPSNLYFEPLKESGGSVEMNVNGTGGKEFYVTCPVNREILIYRVHMILVDGGMEEGLFAGIVGSPLTNGVNIKFDDGNGNTMRDFTASFGNIKKNPDFLLLSGVDGVITLSAGDDIMPVRWTLARAGGVPSLTGGQRFVITLNDDLSSIVYFRTMVQGILR